MTTTSYKTALALPNLPPLAEMCLEKRADHMAQLIGFHSLYNVPMAPLQSEDRQFRHMDDARVALRLGLIVEELRELFADGFGIEAQVLLTVKCPDGVYRCDASEAGMIEEAMTRAELSRDRTSVV